MERALVAAEPSEAASFHPGLIAATAARSLSSLPGGWTFPRQQDTGEC